MKKNIVDYKKYKRFFAFGCSFTKYFWPSWANLIHHEMQDAKFYNLGREGAGNLYISGRVAEANLNCNFNDEDLIMIMWSTFIREDRYINDKWQTHGNIYHNHFYDINYLKKYSCPKGYLYRDLSLLELTTGYLDNIGCDYISMLAVPFKVSKNENPNDHTAKTYADLEERYKNLIEKFPLSMYEAEFANGWDHNLDYPSKIDGGHPATNRYLSYLKKLGFTFGDDTVNYSNNWTNFLKVADTREIVADKFYREHSNIIYSI